MSQQFSESRPARGLAFLCNVIAGISLLALMVITCIDVVGRYLLNNPLTGSTELIEMILALVIFAALPVVTWRNDNVVVDILDRHFSAKAQLIRGVLIHLLFAVSLYFVGNRLLELGNRSFEYGDISEFLHIPIGWNIRIMGILSWVTAATVVTFGIWRQWVLYKSKNIS